MAQPIEVLAPAKVNLTLDVLAKRPDGYHDIRSLMIKVGLYDRLVVEPADAGTIHLECDQAGVPVDEGNLVYQAALSLGKPLGRIPGCRIRLEKAIPVGGGMGGGSSDAAAALRALNALWQTGLSDAALAALGAELGSDIPFFFAESGAIVSGRGDCVEPVRLAFTGWGVLVFGGVHVSTARVYTHVTPQGPESPQGPTRSTESLNELAQAGYAEAMRAGMRNALEPAVFAVAPQVKALCERVQMACGRSMRVSGAGSVLFDVFDTQAEAESFASVVRMGGVTEEIRIVRVPAAQ